MSAEQEMRDLLNQVSAGTKNVILPASQLLVFNEYLFMAGFSVARMEAIKMDGSQAGRRFEYDILANRDYEDAWAIFIDPEKSRAHVREIVTQALGEGGTWEFRVWAEEP